MRAVICAALALSATSASAGGWMRDDWPIDSGTHYVAGNKLPWWSLGRRTQIDIVGGEVLVDRWGVVAGEMLISANPHQNVRAELQLAFGRRRVVLVPDAGSHLDEHVALIGHRRAVVIESRRPHSRGSDDVAAERLAAAGWTVYRVRNAKSGRGYANVAIFGRYMLIPEWGDASADRAAASFYRRMGFQVSSFGPWPPGSGPRCATWTGMP